MAKIELLLGAPTTPEREENIESLISEHDVNMETAIILKVKSLIRSLSEVNDRDENYFELCAYVITGKTVKLPKISFGVYKHNGFALPKLIINGFHLTSRGTNAMHFIDNKLIDEIGLDFENSFDFEYWGFQRVGTITPSKADIIYQLRGKPHIYNSGEFLEVSR